MKILGIESSCDETSISIVENGNIVYSNIISSQIEIHEKYGGVVPEIASRHHIQNISYVFKQCLDEANLKISDIDYIAVTNKPGLIGSLLVGLLFAKGLAYSNNIELIPINHLEGHIYSTFIENEIKLPCISVVVSGGHSSIYYMDSDHNLELLGETLDDAIGEAYDKVAKILGLPYPGGPQIEKQSNLTNEFFEIPIPNIKNYNLSFSGIKTYITNYVNQRKMKNEIIDIPLVSNSFQKYSIMHLKDKIFKAASDKNVDTIIIAGGVSANSYLRSALENDKFNIVFPKKMQYCTDNGAMIAACCYYKLKYNKIELNKNFDAISTKEFHKL